MNSKRPSFQFYPADWRNDPALRMCSAAARGLWMDMLCVMHEATPCGHLIAAGVPITADELARIVGEAVRDVKRWLDELGRRQVYSVTPEGVIFSRRMVRDEKERDGWRERQGRHRGQQRDNERDIGRDNGGGVTAASRRTSSSTPSSEERDDDNARVRAKALTTRICEILRVELQADPERITWHRQVAEMLRDGLSETQIIAAAEIARTRGITKLSYIRTVALSPPKPHATASPNGRLSNDEMGALLLKKWADEDDKKRGLQRGSEPDEGGVLPVAASGEDR